MKTSLDEIRLMEDCLFGRASGGEQLLFAAKLLLDAAFKEDIYWQRKTYGIVREYRREQLRDKLEHLHRELFTAPQHRTFREKVLGIFTK